MTLIPLYKAPAPMLPFSMSRSTIITAPVTIQQMALVLEYIIDLDVERAASVTNYDLPTARKQLKKENVNAYMEAQLLKRFSEHAPKVKEVINQWANAAYLDPLEYYDGEGNLKPLEDLPRHLRLAITNIRQTTYGKGEDQVTHMHYEFLSKDKSLEMLAKYMGMMIDRSQVDVKMQLQGLGESDVDRLLEQYAAQAGFGRVIDGEAETVSTKPT